MNWKSNYVGKIKTADEAVKLIKSGHRVMIGHACGEPSLLVEAMVRRAPELRNVELFHMVCMGKGEYCKEEYKENFYYNGPFAGKGTREAIAAGRGDYVPCFLSEVPKILETRLKPDVALIMVSPPDENGMCSFGISSDYTESVTRRPDTFVIFQINENMPYTYGTTISLDRADVIVDGTDEVITLNPPKIGEIEKKIGENIASLINDGDTLQLGIGAIPDAVLNFLDGKKDLGIHSEMFSDGVLRLARKGVVNNSKKTLHNGKFVVSFLMGTRDLYDFVDHNEDVLVFPCDYTNNVSIISQNDNMVSINSSIQVDLYGQFNSNSIGVNVYSGVGGQVDFIRGCHLSNGGRAIIALPSTTKNDTISKVVCRLDPGASVTTSRYDARYVVTEYGIADLFGLNLRQRAKALIDIAHPNFREQLEKEAWENSNLR